MVYYRKYRPQTIEELDSTKVREILTAILSTKEIPHAFLFTGPKGTGKTSTARIIAKAVNCENHLILPMQDSKSDPKDPKKTGMGYKFEPCNKCNSCISITNGSNIDVLEIDGASNRGIDEIRDLREKVKLAPSSAKKKVYIIDEVHMLTTEAFNALLKTIEEPPDHVMFMFATTEPQKVPPTILSRCFHVAFPRATDEDIVHSLERIVSGEKLDIEKEALQEIAKMADGGFRDGAKMLEEIVAVAGDKKITKELFEEKLKVSGISYLVSSILESLYEKKTKESLEVIKKNVEQGIDIKYFISQILDALHEVLLVKNNLLPNTKYQIQNNHLSLDDIKQLSELLSDAYQQMKFSPIPQLPLELAVVEWCSTTNHESRITNNEKQQIPNSHKGTNFAEGSQVQDDEDKDASVAVASKSGPTIAEVRKKEQNLKVRSIIDGSAAKKAKSENNAAQNGHTQHHISDHKDDNMQLLENIIYKVKSHNHSLAGVLRGCDVATMGDGQLILTTAYKFHQERLNDIKSIEILEQVVREITGKQIKVLVELKG